MGKNVTVSQQGRVGWIELDRPEQLNALTHHMCLDIETALDGFLADDVVTLIGLRAVGDRAFCAGGDLTDLYTSGCSGDIAFGRRFWTDEYRLNAKLGTSSKPIVSFLQGYVLGGGVGVGCHGSHRIVCETSKIALPEVSLGIVPDVGSSNILAKAPGHLGEYLGLTGVRLGAGDAIYAGLADFFIRHDQWPDVQIALEETGSPKVLAEFVSTTDIGRVQTMADQINAVFRGGSLTEIVQNLRSHPSEFATASLDAMMKNNPLAMAATVRIVRQLREDPDLITALDLEYRFTARAVADGDFLEGIRAKIIERDNTPSWTHSIDCVPAEDVAKMLMPLGQDALDLSNVRRPNF